MTPLLVFILAVATGFVFGARYRARRVRRRSVPPVVTAVRGFKAMQR